MNNGNGAFYRASYQTMKGRSDIYIAFFEAALNNLNKNGKCAFICSDRWMLNQYGQHLRNLIATSFNVQAVVNMHRVEAFQHSVSAYTAITVIERNRQGSVIVAKGHPATDGHAKEKEILAPQSESPPPVKLLANLGFETETFDLWFKSTEPWISGSSARLALLRYLEANFQPLESNETFTKVGIGVATGADSIFITKDSSLVEPSRLLPLALAKDLVNGKLKWSGHYLINPWDNRGLIALSQYPQYASYMEQYYGKLSKRHTAQGNPAHWYKTIDRVSDELLTTPKLYIADIQNRLTPVFDTGKTYPHHNLYFIRSDCWNLEVLGGLLMSAVGQFFIECYGVRIGGEYLRFQAQYLRRIRVPLPNQLTSSQIHELKRAFRAGDITLATQIAIKVYGIAPALARLCFGY